MYSLGAPQSDGLWGTRCVHVEAELRGKGQRAKEVGR